MLLALGALILLGTTVMRVNRSILTNETRINSSKIEIQSVFLASYYLDKALGLRFDEDQSGDLANLTPAANLGTDGIESSEASFDDFDDYDGYTATEEISGLTYEVSCNVFYVDQDVSLDEPAASITRHKRCNVSVKYVTIPGDTLKAQLYVIKSFM